MGLFSANKSNKHLLSKPDADEVVAAIQRAEIITSGEVRVFIESKCSYVNAVDRAWEVFFKLKMEATIERNAVLVYLALKDKQMAIIGDEGIHDKVKQDDFWKEELLQLKGFCKQDRVKEGLVAVIGDIGNALCTYFPPREGEQHNEIPDEIVFGK